MTYELSQGVVILLFVFVGLVLRSYFSYVIEASRLKTSGIAICASNFRAIILTLQKNCFQNIATHTSFIMLLVVMAIPLLGSSNVAALPALGVLWLIPIASLIFDERGAKGNRYIARMFALAMSSILLTALALESETVIKILCLFFALIIGRESQITVRLTNNWGDRSESNLPLYFAQFATNTLLFILIYKEIFITNEITIYGGAIFSELVAYLIIDGFFALPNLKRSQDSRSRILLILMFSFVAILSALSMFGGQA